MSWDESPQKLIAEILLTSQSSADPDELIKLARRLAKVPRTFFENQGYVTKRIAVLTGYTSSFIISLTKLYLLSQKIFAEFYESEFGTFEQAIHERDPKLLNFKPDVCYFCVGSDHISLKAESPEPIQRWLQLWKSTFDFLGCNVVQNTFEEPLHRILGNYEFKFGSSISNQVRNLNRELAEKAPSYVHFNDVNFLSSLHGKKTWRDERLYHLSKIPVSRENLIPYSKNLSQVLGAIFGTAKKCLVLDLDNTLWGGVVGDDGVSGIAIGNDTGPGEAYLAFQTYLKTLKNRGVILAVCSKNDEIIAKQPFFERDEMALKLNDISCFKANWDPKPENIKKIALALNISLDSLVFVDDNPAERDLVRQALPEVEVIDLPKDPSEYVLALSSSGLFEPVFITDEDLIRTQQYQAKALFEAEATHFIDYESFLQNLEMKATCGVFTESQLPRITQLVNKTNQFNLTTKRYSEGELRRFAAENTYLTRCIKLSDRFTDHGLISVFIGALEPVGHTDRLVLRIDTWLMSCRVLKRDVEWFLFKNILKGAIKRGVSEIKGVYLPTTKNALVKDLFKDLGFVQTSKEKDGQTYWSFDLKDALKVEAVLNKKLYIKQNELIENPVHPEI